MTIRASSLLEHEKRSRCLLAFERVLRPFLREMEEHLEITRLLVFKCSTDFPPVPSVIRKALRDLKNFEYVICHAPVDHLRLDLFQTLMEFARDNVIAFCHSLIEKKLKILHEENEQLHRKVSTDSISLKSMEEDLSQLPLTQAVLMFSDEFSNLQKGKDCNKDYCTQNTLEKKDSLSHKIQKTRTVIEQKSLKRCEIRRQIHALEDCYQQLVTRTTTVKLGHHLNEIRNARLLPNDNILWIKRFDSLRRNAMGCLRALGKTDVERQYQQIPTMNTSAWILSKGKKLGALKPKEVYVRFADRETEQPVSREAIVQLANPALVIAGPPGSGKTVLCHQFLQSYVSTEPIFPDVHQFELVILLSSSDACQNSFSSHIKKKILPESMRFENPYVGLQRIDTLFVVDFNTAYTDGGAAALAELLRRLGKNKVIITCRSVLAPVIQKALRNTNTSFQSIELLPFSKDEVYLFSCDALASAYPRSSTVENICKRFSEALNYRKQGSLLHPLPLIYLLNAWREDSSFAEDCSSLTELLAFHYAACKTSAEGAPCYSLLDQRRATASPDAIFDEIQEKAMSAVLNQDVNLLCFASNNKIPINTHKVHPFVMSFGNSKHRFVHFVAVEYLLAEHVLGKLEYKIWPFKRKTTLQDYFGAQEDNPTFGKYTLTYLFLSSMITRSNSGSLPLKVPLDELEYLASLFCHSCPALPPDWLDLVNLLREARFHPRFIKFIKKNSSIVSPWSPSSQALSRNVAAKILIEEKAFAPKVVKLCGTEPAAKSIIKALVKVPSTNVFCYGKNSVLDDVICHLEGTKILREFQGCLQEKGCSAVRGMLGLRKLFVTVSSMTALEALCASLKTPAVRKQLELLDVGISFKIESNQRLPCLVLGKAQFTLRLDDVNLETPGAAVRILKELECTCKEVVLTRVQWSTSAARDVASALAPTLVTIVAKS